jgi:large subunit ribosomal protein L24
MKIKKQDTVLIISGKDKGKKGKVIQTYPSKNKIVVENVNLRKKNVKAKKSGEKGQIVQFPAPISLSNAMIICSKCLKATKIKYDSLKEKKVRICKKCEKEI